MSHILCGDVLFDNEVVRDPKSLVGSSCDVRYREQGYVSRGGTKLDFAIERFNIPVEGRVALDAGASTGGFTDALLRRGAVRVHAVDVGYNQLDYRIRTDPRVVVHERTNLMSIRELDPVPHFAVLDLSFRSLKDAARHAAHLTSLRFAVALVKPQFEWANPPGNFDGRVPDDESRAIADETLTHLAGEGLVCSDLAESPIRGRMGNREFLVLLRLQDENASRPSGAPM